MNQLAKLLLSEFEKFFQSTPDAQFQVNDKGSDGVLLTIELSRGKSVYVEIHRDVCMRCCDKSRVFPGRFFGVRHLFSDMILYLFNDIWPHEERPSTFPRMKQSEFATLLCDSATGHILTKEGYPYWGWGEVYKVHETLEGALERSRRYNDDQYGEIECTVYDNKRKVVNSNEL